MIVTLDRHLFEPTAPARMRCLRLVLAADERRHVLLTDPAWDRGADDHPVQQCLARMDNGVVEFVSNVLEASLDDAADMGLSVARIRVEPMAASRWEDGVLSPEDALRLMQTPLWLVLENGRNDLQFLRRILEKKDRDALDEHLAEGRIEVPLGGGTGELKLFLENLATLPSTRSDARQTTNWIRRLRSWVMFDRDAHEARDGRGGKAPTKPNDPRLPSATSENLRALCAEMTRPRPFPGYQLGRRTIENYLPIHALSAWAEAGDGPERTRRRAQVEAFMSSDFGEERRACFAMKEGLVKDVASTVREELGQRGHKQRKLKNRAGWVHEAKLPAAQRTKLRTRVRWLEDAELPAVFQGMKDAALRRRLERGFGSKIAELFGDFKDCQDEWFQDVFKADPDKKWRTALVESLWAVL